MFDLQEKSFVAFDDTVLCADNTIGMTVAVNIDDKLLRDGLEISGQLSEETLLNEALREYIQKRARQKIVDAFGSFDFDPDYDYKALRNR